MVFSTDSCYLILISTQIQINEIYPDSHSTINGIKSFSLVKTVFCVSHKFLKHLILGTAPKPELASHLLPARRTESYLSRYITVSLMCTVALNFTHLACTLLNSACTARNEKEELCHYGTSGFSFPIQSADC